MDPSTHTKNQQPPPYFPTGSQIPGDPKYPDQQQIVSVDMVQEQNPTTATQETSDEPENGCTCLCTLKWIGIALLVIIFLPLMCALWIVVVITCPGILKREVEPGNN